MATAADMRLLLRRRSIVVQDRAEAALLGEQRIAAVVEQVQVERLVGLLLAVALHLDGDGLRRLAGGEGQRPGLADVVVVAGRRGAVHGLERHRHRLVVRDRERDREGEQGCFTFLPSAFVTSVMLMRGSLSTMVPTPCASLMNALVGPLKVTAKVSFASPRRSPLTSTVTVPVVWPAGMSSVPEAAW